MEIDQIKQAIGKKGAELVKNGMTVGLGTGTSAEQFIKALIQRKKELPSIQIVSSSQKSLELAKQGGLFVIDINEALKIDLTVDGADEIDPQKRMIKGGGGAHLREKILATSSEEMLVIVDETKLVDKLGTHHKLPVEVVSFGFSTTKRRLEKLGYVGAFRTNSKGDLFITENGNLLFDITFPAPCENPENIHKEILEVPGVVDTGFFFNFAGRVIVGYLNGKIEIRN